MQHLRCLHVFSVYSGRDCTSHLKIVLRVWGCCSQTDECRLYLECRFLDMRTGAPDFAAGEYVVGGNLY